MSQYVFPKRRKATFDNPSKVDIETLEAVRGFENPKSVAYKTVDTFAGITRKKLFLKNGKEGSAHTDGYSIEVDLEAEDMYLSVEHELGHILFKSDAVAKKKFLAEYTARVILLGEKFKIEVDKNKVVEFIDFLINLTEDHRIESLWGILYPGSAAQMRARDVEMVRPHIPDAHKDICTLYAAVRSGLDLASGEMDWARPIFEKALKKVENTGFGGTLAVTKWMLKHLVDEIIKQSTLPPREDSDPEIGTQGEGEGAGDAGKGEEGESTGETESVPAPQGGGEGNAGTGSGGQELDYSSPKDRTEAFNKLLGMAKPPPDISKKYDDVKDPGFKPPKAVEEQAKNTVEKAMKLDVGKEEKLESFLDESEKDMESVVENAKRALRTSMSEDSWLKKDAMTKVVFKDVREFDFVPKPPDLPEEDRETIRRLRTIFYRVLGRKKFALDESGSEIDIPAYIERRLTNVPIPCFKHEEQGRGFKALILLDRSASMNEGDKTYQAERAGRIILRALKFPFVSLDIWGFQSLDDGQVDISRFDAKNEVFNVGDFTVGGNTPLHIAMKVGVKFLEKGAEKKQLIVITDGQPQYRRADKKIVSTSQLQHWVHDETLVAIKQGINVTCALIGGGIEPRMLSWMFGGPHSWRILPQDRMGTELVNLVSASFVQYLKQG
jgi:hypothetical protein